jgi:electron transfer flavoprotein beta subunit
MHTIVCVKQVLDTRAMIKVREGRIVQEEPALVKSANPKDLAALEEAMQLKARFGGEVTVISVGDKEVRSVLQQCLARGADRAIHVSCNDAGNVPAHRLIGEALKGLRYDLILCGNRSSNEGRGCVVPYLADFLGLPQATKVVRLVDFDREKYAALVWRQLERGWREEVECRLPAVFGIERSSYEQPYVSVFSREKSLNKRLMQVEAALAGKGELFEFSLEMIKITPPRPRTKKTYVPDAALPPEERFKLLLSGGAEPKKGDDFIEDSPTRVARAVVDFLRDQGLINTAERVDGSEVQVE